MPRRSVEERLRVERARRTKIEGEIRKLEAEEAAASRARDTRRKMLVGSFVLDLIVAGDVDRVTAERVLRKGLPNYLKRSTDKELLAEFLGPSGAADSDLGYAFGPERNAADADEDDDSERPPSADW